MEMKECTGQVQTVIENANVHLSGAAAGWVSRHM